MTNRACNILHQARWATVDKSGPVCYTGRDGLLFLVGDYSCSDTAGNDHGAECYACNACGNPLQLLLCVNSALQALVPGAVTSWPPLT